MPPALTPEAPQTLERKPRRTETKNLTRRGGVWYFHKLVNGRREYCGRATPFSLETRELALAKAKRDAILKAATREAIDKLLGQETRGAATVGEIIAAYLEAPTCRANAAVRRRNVADLRRAIVWVFGKRVQVDWVSSAKLTKAFWKRWQTLKLEEAAADWGEDRAQLEAAKRGINSTMAHVKSIFSQEALDDYGALRLPPGIRDFIDALPIAARRQEEPVQLTDAAVNALLEALPDLRAADPGVWCAFQLMAWGGLRNKECVHAVKGWLEQLPGGYRVAMKAAGNFVPKGKSRFVMLPAAVVQQILELLPAADDHLVPARTKTDRMDACYRRLNAWLGARGVATDANKVAYRLRKYFLKKVEEQQGLAMAQLAAGHASAQTTQAHYTGTPTMQAPISIPK